jgi:hypothetical protein
MYGPSENTLTVNATHQMLSDLENSFQTLAVLSPSRKMENVLGYDVQLPLQKSVVFQYKRPYTAKTDNKRRFKMDKGQWRTLVSIYSRGEAFFTFPTVIDPSDLNATLENTVFVDVHGLKYNTSLVYVPQNPSGASKTPRVEAKIRNGRKYPVFSKHIYTWSDLVDEISECRIGVRFRDNGDQTREFSRFKRRVNRLREGDVDSVMDRIEELAEEQEGEDWDVGVNHNDLGRIRRELHSQLEEGVDLATHKIGNSRHAMFGGQS